MRGELGKDGEEGERGVEALGSMVASILVGCGGGDKSYQIFPENLEFRKKGASRTSGC